MLVLILIGVLLGGDIANAQDNSTREMTFFVTFVPNIQFAPVYAMIANGHAAEAGLDITVDYGDENVVVDLLASGEYEFGIVSGEQVILARGGDRPVVFVYEWFQQYPVGVIVPSDSGIETVADLEGERIGLPGPFGATYTGLIALLAANGLTENDVQLEFIGFNAPDVMCSGNIGIASVYINNEPLQIAQRAERGDCGDIRGIRGIRLLPVAEAADMVSNGIVTNEDMLADNPELVSSVVSAFDAGLRDVINNPAAAYLLSLDFVDTLPIDDNFRTVLEIEAQAQEAFLATNPDREAIAESRLFLSERLSEMDPALLIQFDVLLASIELWDADVLGQSDLASWELTRDVLTNMGLLDEELDVEAAFTNDFLPEPPVTEESDT
jgi:NitT/TauT family transport system substrate-binding protein